MRPLRVRARAKLNLTLRVVGRRADGYHDIETVMQALELFDEVELEPAASTDVSFASMPGFIGRLPEAPDLVRGAIEVFERKTTSAAAFRAHVVKGIPLGSGLGGGSADAAAALLGLREMTGRALSADELFEMAAEIGSDVPFGLQGGTAYASGRGERIRALPAPRRFWWVIGFPRFEMSTSEVYRRFDEMRLDTPGSEISVLKDALRDGDPVRLAGLLRNDLELPAFDLKPELESLKGRFVSAGALGSVMAGSGSAMAGLCRSEDHAIQVASVLEATLHVQTVASAIRGAEVLASTRKS